MKYELEQLELLCTDQQLQNLEEKNQLQKSIAQECNQIKSAWKNKVLSASNENHKEQYIQDHQKGITVLTENIKLKIKHSPSLPFTHAQLIEYLALCKNIYNSLGQLLNYLEEYFPKFFNYEADVPAHIKRVDILHIKNQRNRIETWFTNRKVKRPLVALLTNTIDNILHPGMNTSFSFRKVQYLKRLTAALLEIINIDLEETEIETKVNEVLFFNNFNCRMYFNYCITKITKALEEEDTFEKRLNNLAFELKRNNQSQIKPDVSFDREYRPIKEQLANWLKEEIKYLEKTKQLTIPFQPTAQKADSTNFKVVLNLSVAQLAYLTRLLVESGIIENKNKKELLRFISGIVKTKKTPEVTQEGLRVRYYNVEDNTVEVVRELLQNLTKMELVD